MPVSGRKPKEGPKRNHVAPVHDWTEVADVAFLDAPSLPSARRKGKGWPKRTRDWWAAVSSMPHCVLWSTSDWSFAIDTAYVAAEYHSGERAGAATELRQREKILGVTRDSRRDLRIRYVSVHDEADDDGQSAEVVDIGDYRDLGDI